MKKQILEFRKSCKWTVLMFLIVTLFACYNTASAFDGQRKGFIIGIGVGPGYTTFVSKVKDYNYISDRESKFGFQTDFKIGYAPSNNLEIFYSNKISWFGLEDRQGDKNTMVHGLSSIAASYFFQQDGPTAFVSAGFGLAVHRKLIVDEKTDPFNGFGFFIGGGYEFSDHWDISGNLLWGNPGKSGTGRYDYKTSINAVTFQVTINFMAY